MSLSMTLATEVSGLFSKLRSYPLPFVVEIGCVCASPRARESRVPLKTLDLRRSGWSALGSGDLGKRGNKSSERMRSMTSGARESSSPTVAMHDASVVAANIIDATRYRPRDDSTLCSHWLTGINGYSTRTC